MPITAFQKEVLQIIARQRSPESHAAGGMLLNRAPDSPRFSKDMDIFHDAMEGVIVAAEADAAALMAAGYEVSWQLRSPMLQRAVVTRAGQELRLDWCFDSAFRFFPIQPDADFGYCLHPADVAVNKVLALAGRNEIRDYIDILYLHRTSLRLGALCWAASGKDPGLTPWLVLELAKRNVKYQPEQLAEVQLTEKTDLQQLKLIWLQAADEATALFDRLPAEEIGCLYLDAAGKAVTPDPASPEFAKLVRHFASIRGAWPRPTEQS
jgi:Nucleotidyl transferase AbiEii toxin, Type IV TA system